MLCWKRHEADLCTYRRNLRAGTWVLGSGPASSLAIALALEKLFPKVTPAKKAIPSEFKDANFLHSVDLLVATPMVPLATEGRLILRCLEFCYELVTNGKFFLLAFRWCVRSRPAFIKLMSLATVFGSELRLSGTQTRSHFSLLLI